jgi:hypothetical protein
MQTRPMSLISSSGRDDRLRDTLRRGLRLHLEALGLDVLSLGIQGTAEELEIRVEVRKGGAVDP